MNRMHRLVKKFKSLKLAASRLTPNKRERELGKRLDEIEAKYKGRSFDDVPDEVTEEYGRLQRELMMEEQRRAGLVLIDFKPTDEPEKFLVDPSNLLRMVDDIAQLMDAGMSYENACARALQDEMWRQDQERKAA